MEKGNDGRGSAVGGSTGPAAGSGTGPDPELVSRLREAVAAVGRGAPLVDTGLEKRLAPLVSKANRLISHRDRSEAELRDRLTDALEPGEDPRLVDTVIRRCLDNGMLDDRRFATEWVRQRAHTRQRSIAVLRRELRDKGVSSTVIEEALGQITVDDQREILHALVGKKAATIRTAPADRADYDRMLRRIVGVAARRGFPQGESLTAARSALDSRIRELRGQDRNNGQ
ncbi:Regulatory protein RecX [Corynebacterium provencense]|uniref:Regulatory protein RecX n=1 Tax=Corynebacterium provencense TaxID=1737425 RepID=A0A2Z3YX74_9CORY|nr:regulatory protein RecX [Corynebacterium provencense]AWT26033.1 Regulatory protein RecX [Corynebacterium provencense]